MIEKQQAEAALATLQKSHAEQKEKLDHLAVDNRKLKRSADKLEATVSTSWFCFCFFVF